jgi:hypothetical protein
MALIRERNIPTERPPFVDKLAPAFADIGCYVSIIITCLYSYSCGGNLAFRKAVLNYLEYQEYGRRDPSS